MIDPELKLLQQKQSLTTSQTAVVINHLMSGNCPDETIARLLTLLYEKGESEDELAGAAIAMRRHMTVIESDHPHIVDTCGTGGSGANTFNISTAAAIVASAAGATIAKHGNRAATSHSGSADVLVELGVNIEPEFGVVQQSLQELGVCFCFAPLFHQSVKNVISVRRKLTFPTIFNLLGPLCNPANANHQVLGAGRGSTQELLAKAIAKLGTSQSVVVHGNDGLGEITTTTSTRVFLISGTDITETEWNPEDFGLRRSEKSSLTAESPKHSAKIIREILAGKPGPCRDITVANAAAALFVSGMFDDLRLAADHCQSAIDDQKASRKLNLLVELTNR